MASSDQTRRDLYQEVTNRIVAALEAGAPPWRRPWNPDIAAPTGPLNAVSGHRYRGINVLLLGSHPLAWETGDPRFCSYKQAADKGWQVRKGEKASTVLFFKRLEVPTDSKASTDDEDATKTVAMLRSYPVFHASQIDGIPPYVPPTTEEAPWRRPEAADIILKNSGVSVRTGGDRAFYSPSTDHVQLPPDAAFSNREAWATTALHELGHATGHPSRLDRDLRNRFGSAAYAMEELRAELASAFMAAELGIPSELSGHASYVESWLSVLKQDKREILRAAADAQRIADWCLARHPDYRLSAPEAAEKKSESGPMKPEPTAIAANAVPKPQSTGFRPLGEAMPEHLKRRLGIAAPEPVTQAAVPDAAPAYTQAP